MELTRLYRVFRARWVVVLLGSLVGLTAGVAFTELANHGLDPIFEASMAVLFEADDGEGRGELEAQIQDETDLARSAARQLLSQYPGSAVLADIEGMRLVFIARGESEDQARERAEAIVQSYLDTDPLSGGEIADQLAEYERQAADIAAEIEEIQPELSPEEQELLAEHRLLDRQITAIEDQIVSLAVADAGANTEEQAANAQAREDLRALLADLRAQKGALPPRPSEELSAPVQLQLDALQRRLDILRLDYEALALRSMGVTNVARAEPAMVTDLTPEPGNSVFNGVVGLVAGTGLALVALYLVTRLRKEVWLDSDLAVPVLARIPARAESSGSNPTWYDSAEGERRKENIQALRTALAGALGRPPVAFALVGVSVDSVSCQTLAVDVAASFANSGREVLLIDADYSDASQVNDVPIRDPTLNTVLRLPLPELRERVKEILSEVAYLRSNLAVMPAGNTPQSPADAIAGWQIELLIEEARSIFDIVVVAAGPAKSASTRGLVQRVGTVVLAVKPGTTATPEVASIVSDMTNANVRLVGSVMIVDSESRGLHREFFTSRRRATLQADAEERSNPATPRHVNDLDTVPISDAIRIRQS